MDTYDRYTNLGKKILPILLSSMVEAENFSDHTVPTSEEPCTSDMLNLIQCIHQYNISTKTAIATKI